MCPQNDKSHVEAWKSLIELAKTNISIASAVLTAVIGFLIVNKSDFSGFNYNFVPIILLAISILMSIYGFGRAIRAIKTGNSETCGVLFINTSVIFLVIAMLSFLFVKIDHNKSLDSILAIIESESKNMETQLSPNLLIKVEVIDSNYLVSYKVNDKIKHVTFSQKQNNIIRLE